MLLVRSAVSRRISVPPKVWIKPPAKVILLAAVTSMLAVFSRLNPATKLLLSPFKMTLSAVISSEPPLESRVTLFTFNSFPAERRIEPRPVSPEMPECRTSPLSWMSRPAVKSKTVCPGVKFSWRFWIVTPLFTIISRSAKRVKVPVSPRLLVGTWILASTMMSPASAPPLVVLTEKSIPPSSMLSIVLASVASMVMSVGSRRKWPPDPSLSCVRKLSKSMVFPDVSIKPPSPASLEASIWPWKSVWPSDQTTTCPPLPASELASITALSKMEVLEEAGALLAPLSVPPTSMRPPCPTALRAVTEPDTSTRPPSE